MPSAGYTPAKVLAATYSYRDRRLWVLDEAQGHGALKKARLVRLDPLTGEFEQIGEWLRPGLFERHWLGLDKDGEILLTASSKLLRRHMVVRFDNHPSSWALDRVFLGKGALGYKPLVDQEGYSFIIEKKPLQAVHDTETRRVADLGHAQAGWGHLGSCW